MSRKNKIIILISAVFVAFAVISFYIKIPYVISSRGIVYPVREWSLSKTTDGNLLNILKDNKTNSINHYSVTEFVRGDASEFIINKNIFSKNIINKGDTVGFIYSNEEQYKLLELEGQLAAEKNMLAVFSTGEKPENIQHQKEILELALQEFETQKKLFERIEKLFKDSLISKNDYDIALNELKIKEHTYKIAETYLTSLKSGAKSEQLSFNKSLIQSLEFQIEQLKKRIKCNTILSPFTGIVVKQKNNNVDMNGDLIDVENIIKVADISSFLVLLPIESYETENIKIGGKVNFLINKDNETIKGEIIDIDNTVQIIKRREVTFVTVELKDNIDMITLSKILDAEIDCGTISFIEYFKRIFNTITEN